MSEDLLEQEGQPKKRKKFRCAGSIRKTDDGMVFCDYESDIKWLGKCPQCNRYYDIIRTRPDEDANRTTLASLANLKPPEPISTGSKEFDHVLGGGIYPGASIVLTGSPGAGKCLSASARLLDPSTGDFVSISEWVHRDSVVSLDSDNLKLRASRAPAFFERGTKPVIEIETRLGRILRCTAEHPFRTIEGWVPASSLTTKSRIATPRSLPFFGTESVPPHEIKLIAYVIGDGSSVNPTVGVTASTPEIISDMQEIARAFDLNMRVYEKSGTATCEYRMVKTLKDRFEARQILADAINSVQASSGISFAEWARRASVDYAMLMVWHREACVPSADELQRLADAIQVPLEKLRPDARERAAYKNPVADFFDRIGLRHLRAAQKHVPDCVFRLPKPEMVVFLRALFSTDGSVCVTNASDKDPGSAQVSYASTSRRLVEDVAHLLLRFGFVAKIRTKKSTYKGEPYTSYELVFNGLREVRRFLSEIGIAGREDAKEAIAKIPDVFKSSTHRDVIPGGPLFWSWLFEAIGDDSFDTVSKKAGKTIDNRRHDRPLCASTVQALVDAYDHQKLRALAYGDVHWDEVRRITSCGEEPVYDISVPGDESFVANDIVVHNSTLLLATANAIAQGKRSCMYASGEQSASDVGLIAKRLNALNDRCTILGNEGDIYKIVSEAERRKPTLLIVDSVQTAFISDIGGDVGSPEQIKGVINWVQSFCKVEKVASIIVAHVTKDGQLSGPKALQHLCDTVAYLDFYEPSEEDFEDDEYIDDNYVANLRELSVGKNRYGPSGVREILEMTSEGMKPPSRGVRIKLA